MESKRLGLLHQLIPTAELIAVLINPNNPPAADQLRDVQEAARTIGQKIQIFYARSAIELDAAFAASVKGGAKAMLVAGDPSFNSQRNKIIALAASHAMPAIYEQREHAEAGGLMSYGTSLSDGYRQVGIYTGRILKGEKPADLPVVQSTKFEFVINLKTAKALSLDVPPSLSAQADEIIE
jgi:putative ABC transport system substrate-binding protein